MANTRHGTTMEVYLRPIPSWDSSPQEHLRIACVAKFHHCSWTLVCHRSSTHPRGCRSALGSTPQCILCHTGSSESRTSCCLLAVVTLNQVTGGWRTPAGAMT